MTEKRPHLGGVFESWLQLVLTIAVVVVFIGGLALAWGGWRLYENQQAILGNQDDGRRRGYVSRAEDCRLQLGLGFKLGPGCVDPALTTDVDGGPYFDTDEKIVTRAASTSQSLLSLFCRVLHDRDPNAPPERECLPDEGG